jgi:hypothetical protein
VVQAQQIMKQRIAEAATEKAAREKWQEEAESAKKSQKKLQEKHDTMIASTNSGQNTSAGEWKMQQERDKLWVSSSCVISIFD